MNLETYCPIPFSEMFIRPDGRVLICCDTQKAVGNVNSTSLSEIFYSNFLQDVRKTFKNGERHRICNKCWDREDKIGDSFRSSHNQDGSIEMLSGNKYTNYKDFAQHATTRIRKIKVDFSNACNMKCPMCNIARSTGWLKDWEKFNGVFKSSTDADVNYLNRPLNEQAMVETVAQLPISFIDDNWEHFINANLIDLSGGEPFYMPQVKYLLDRLEKERYNGVLKVITNASLIEPFIDKLAKFNCKLVISCDAHGEDLYPIARPSVGKTISWQKFTDNLKLLREAKVGHGFCYVPQLMNIHNIEDWLDWVDENYDSDVNKLGLPLYRPNHLRIEHYPNEDYKHKLAERLEHRHWSRFDAHNFRALIQQLRMPAVAEHYETFLTYMARLDELRNTNFMAIWAENT
jgi:MoaA/NifB/PqqE/SkfB family radical SAM enzyme